MKILATIALSVLLTHPIAHAVETIKVVAGAAPLENIFGRIKPKFESESGIKLELVKATHVTSLQDVEASKADVACVGMSFEEWTKQAEKDGAKLKKNGLKHRVIGKDNLAFVTHKTGSSKKLSNDELKKIFLGTNTEWSPVIAEDLPGLVGMVKEKILGGADFGANVTKIKGALPELKAHIKKTPNVIAFVPMGAVDAEMVKLETETLGRPVTAVTNGAPSAKVVKLFDFISKNSADHAK